MQYSGQKSSKTSKSSADDEDILAWDSSTEKYGVSRTQNANLHNTRALNTSIASERIMPYINRGGLPPINYLLAHMT